MHMPVMDTKAIDGQLTKDAAVLRFSLQQLASDYLNLLTAKNSIAYDLELARARLAQLETAKANEQAEQKTPLAAVPE